MIRKLLKDSLSCAFVPFLKVIITFIMAPVIVHALGNYDYGVWEMVFAIIGYMEFLDLGLMPAIIRNVARFNALKDREELQRIYSSSMAFFLPVGIILAAGFIGVSLFAPELIMKVVASNSHKYSIFFIIIAVYAFFVFVGSVFDCCLEGFMLYDIRNYTNIFFSVAGSAIMYPLLINGGGLLTLALIHTSGMSLKYLFYGFLLSKDKYGGLTFKYNHVSWRTFKGLFDFGVKSFVWALSLRISILSDPLVIGSFLGAATVPFYMIPSNLIGQGRNIVWSVTRVFLPTFSGLDALNEKEKTRELYFGASRFMVGIVVPLIGGILLLGPGFISRWMGPEYGEKGETVLLILAAAYLLQWLNPFCKRFLTAINRHEILARAGMVSAALNLGLSITLVKVIGKEGVALGTLIPAILFEPYFLYKTCREMGCNIQQYCRKVFLPLLVPALVFVLAISCAKSFIQDDSFLHIAILAFIGMVVYTPFFAAFAMKQTERQKVYCRIREKVFSGVQS